MADLSKYTPEELAFYLHQTTVKKAARLKIDKPLNDVQEQKRVTKQKKREIKELKRQSKLERKALAQKKTEYWSVTTPKYRRYIDAAQKRGFTFALSMEEFNSLTLDKQCVFCGGTDVGVDRIDSTQGYHIDNCQSCCTICNIMKRNMTDEIFLLHIKKIYDKRLKVSL